MGRFHPNENRVDSSNNARAVPNMVERGKGENDRKNSGEDRILSMNELSDKKNERRAAENNDTHDRWLAIEPLRQVQ